MPTPNEILAGLAAIANDWRLVAIGWHILVGCSLVALIFGWRPARHLAASLLVLPLLSVSILAWIAGNPFNGSIFLIFTALLLYQARNLPDGPAHMARPITVIYGALMIAFGWVYPHFLTGSPWWTYLYAAPVGLVPCPTISIVIGFALLFNGFQGRAWPITLSILGFFYGAFGLFRLGVTLDLALLLGAAALLITTLVPPRERIPENEDVFVISAANRG
jgi:hypothetical protein